MPSLSADLGTVGLIGEELVNDSAGGNNDDVLLYGKAGAAFLVDTWGRLDVYYARRQAPDDGFSSNTVNLLFSMTF